MQKTAAVVPGALLARETASAHPVRGGPFHVGAQEDRRGTLQIFHVLEKLQGSPPKACWPNESAVDIESLKRRSGVDLRVIGDNPAQETSLRGRGADGANLRPSEPGLLRLVFPH